MPLHTVLYTLVLLFGEEDSYKWVEWDFCPEEVLVR